MATPDVTGSVRRLRLGSLRVDVESDREADLATLGALFRQVPSDRPREPAEPDVRLRLRRVARGTAPFDGDAERDGEESTWTVARDGRRSLLTGPLHVAFGNDSRPPGIVLSIRDPQRSERAFRDQLLAIVVRLLFTFDRIYLHAAALAWRSRVSLFVGESGFGKTTLTIRLAREGATVLTEDHVLVRRSGGGFTVSGCQDTVRVTAKTAAHFFPDGLAAEVVREEAGKREFRIADLFAAAPYVDHAFHRLFFLRRADHLRISPLSPATATVRLMHMTRGFFRSLGRDDLDHYLAYLGALAAGPECFDLELGPDLRELDALVERLR